VDVGLLARLAGALGGVLADAAGLALGLRLDLAGALLRRLDDRADLIGGRCRERRGRGLLLALELADGVGDLAQGTIDLVRLVAAAGCREVVSLDEVTVQFQELFLP